MYLLETHCGFLGASKDYDSASLVLMGAPMDTTVSFRPGTREGPVQVRVVSAGLEEYSPHLNRSLSDCVFFDAGDVILPFGGVKESLYRIGKVAQGYLTDGKFLLVIGGEHLISLPLVTEAARLFPDLAVLQFDAHADLRDDYLGEEYSHATVMRRIVEVVGKGNLYQFGIRSGTGEEFSFAAGHTYLFLDEVVAPLKELLPQLRGRPLYVTLDIDVIDPAYAPGTGTPEPCGRAPQEIFNALYLLKDLNVVAADLVEINPVCDLSQRTALLGAKIVREMILMFAKRKAS